MPDEKQPSPPLRRATGAAPVPQEPDYPTTENPPLSVGGRFQWSNLPIWGKWVGGAVAAFLLAVMPAIQQWRASRAEEAAARVAAAAAKTQAQTDHVETVQNQVYVKVTKPEIDDLKKQLAELKAQVVAERAAKRAGEHRRPILPVPVPKPKPLPATADAVLHAPAPVSGPIITPLPPRAVDAGQ